MKNTIRIILITLLLLVACNKQNTKYDTTYDADAMAFADSVYDAELLRERMEQYESEGKEVAASRRKTDWWKEKEYVETDYVSRSTYKDNDGYKMTFGEYLRVGFWMVVIVGVVALILIL